MSMWMDIFLVALAYLYVFFIILISEGLRRKLGLSTEITRKSIHLFAGLSVIFILWFSHVVYPLVVAGGLGLLTAYQFLKKERGIFSQAMIGEEYGKSKLHAYGPLYYIVSIFLLVLLFFSSYKDVAIVSTFVMAWGDGAAAIIGKRAKKRHTLISKDKSLEGSLAMFIFGFIGALAGELLVKSFQATQFSVPTLLIISLAVSVIATVVEFISVGPAKPFDNFTVPFSVAAALFTIRLLFLKN